MKKIDKLNAIKYGLVFILVMYVIVLLRGTGKTHTSFEKLEQCVTSTVSMKGMKVANKQELKRYYQLNAEEFDEVKLYCSEDSMGVNEILLVMSSDEQVIEQAAKAVEERLNIQKKNFDGYGTNQIGLLKKSVIVKRENVLLFVVAPNAEQCRKEFLKEL